MQFCLMEGKPDSSMGHGETKGKPKGVINMNRIRVMSGSRIVWTIAFIMCASILPFSSIAMADPIINVDHSIWGIFGYSNAIPVAVSPNGEWLVTINESGSWILFNMRTKEYVQNDRNYYHRQSAITYYDAVNFTQNFYDNAPRFSKDGTKLYYIHEYGIGVYDLIHHTWDDATQAAWNAAYVGFDYATGEAINSANGSWDGIDTRNGRSTISEFASTDPSLFSDAYNSDAEPFMDKTYMLTDKANQLSVVLNDAKVLDVYNGGIGLTELDELKAEGYTDLRIQYISDNGRTVVFVLESPDWDEPKFYFTYSRWDTEEYVENPILTKEFSMPIGTTTPDIAFTFDFEATYPASATATEITNTGQAPWEGAHILEFSPESQSTTQGGTKVVMKQLSDEILRDLQFPNGGTFWYRVTESNDGEYNVHYDERAYWVAVLVANIEGTPTVREILVFEDTDGDIGDKADTILFENTYFQLGELVVTKDIIGDYADMTKLFDFTVTAGSENAGLAASLGAPTEVIGNIYDNNGNLVDSVTLNGSATQASFQLGRGWAIVFDSVMAGSSFTVSENAEDYDASIVITYADGTVSEITGDSTGSYRIGYYTNSFNFTNELPEVTPTGMLLQALPYFLAALVITGIIVISSKRKELLSDEL